MFDIYPAQVQPGINDCLYDLLEELNPDIDSRDLNILEVIDQLRRVEDGKKIDWTWIGLMSNDPIKYPGFAPINRDGIFYETDANQQLINGDVLFNGTLLFGLNSFEGSLAYLLYPTEWFDQPDKIKNIFTLLSGFKTVPMFQQDQIVQLYFQTYKGII